MVAAGRVNYGDFHLHPSTFSLRDGGVRTRPLQAALSESPQNPDHPILDMTRRVEQVLANWLAERVPARSSGPRSDACNHNQLYYKLQHDYADTAGPLSMAALRAEDLSRVQRLQDACHKARQSFPIDMFLAVLEKEVSLIPDRYVEEYNQDCCEYVGDEDDDDDEDGEDDNEVEEVDKIASPAAAGVEIETFWIKSLVDLQGNKIVSGRQRVILNTEYMLGGDGDDFFDDEMAVYECYDEYGNECRRYQAASIVVMPRDAVVSFFTQADMWPLDPSSLEGLATYFRNAATMSRPLSAGLGHVLRELRVAVNSTRNPIAARLVLPKILTAALELEDRGLFDDTVSSIREAPALDFWSEAGALIADVHGHPNLFPICKPGLTRLMLRRMEPSDRIKALWAFRSVNVSRTAADLGIWCCQILARTLKDFAAHARVLGERDGVLFCDVVNEYCRPPFFMDWVIPLLRVSYGRTAFMIALLNGLRPHAENGRLLGVAEQSPRGENDPLPDIAGLRLWEGIAEQMILKMSPLLPGWPDATEPRNEAIRPQTMAQFLADLVSPQTSRDLVEFFKGRVLHGARPIPAIEFSNLWLPALRDLLSILESRSIEPTTNPDCQWLFCLILGRYTEGVVGGEPKDSGRRVRDPVSCRCFFCLGLNEFLQDPNRSTTTFTLGAAEQQHLRDKLADRDCECHMLGEGTVPHPMLRVVKYAEQEHREHAEWVKRRAEADRWFAEEFGLGRLEPLLGAEFTAITGRQPMPPPGQGSSSSSSAKRPRIDSEGSGELNDDCYEYLPGTAEEPPRDSQTGHLLPKSAWSKKRRTD